MTYLVLVILFQILLKYTNPPPLGTCPRIKSTPMPHVCPMFPRGGEGGCNWLVYKWLFWPGGSVFWLIYLTVHNKRFVILVGRLIQIGIFGLYLTVKSNLCDLINNIHQSNTIFTNIRHGSTSLNSSNFNNFKSTRFTKIWCWNAAFVQNLKYFNKALQRFLAPL